MKKGDFIIIAIVVIAVVLSALAFVSFDDASRVIIKQNNKIVYDQSIDQNAAFNTGTNLVIIEDGAVYVKEATCKNGDCVKLGKITKKGESIICLPNKVIVEIE
ncbi:MAG: NusG domain II-containing protein [Clostridia bacterium]|nr:NusG domain II-containing protein [Clostridia bacterium]